MISELRVRNPGVVPGETIGNHFTVNHDPHVHRETDVEWDASMGGEGCQEGIKRSGISHAYYRRLESVAHDVEHCTRLVRPHQAFRNAYLKLTSV